MSKTGAYYNMEAMTSDDFRKMLEDFEADYPPSGFRRVMPMTPAMCEALQKAAEEYLNGTT